MKAAFDGGSRPELAALFRKHGGPPAREAECVPEDSGLPLLGASRATEWRWLGPWVVDSLSFGADRGLAATAHDQDQPRPVDGWLYAFDWPRDERGYATQPSGRSFVRCRRWVRPRERDETSPKADNSPHERTVKFFT